MPPARRKTTRKQPRRGSAARTGDAALKRLNSSLDAAQDALTELRKNLGRGGRGVVNDVHKRVTDLRKDARKLNKSVRSELDQLQKSIAGGRPSTGARRTGGRKAATSKAGARKPAGARRKTAARSGAKRSAKSASSAKSARSAGSAGSKGG